MCRVTGTPRNGPAPRSRHRVRPSSARPAAAVRRRRGSRTQERIDSEDRGTPRPTRQPVRHKARRTMPRPPGRAASWTRTVWPGCGDGGDLAKQSARTPRPVRSSPSSERGHRPRITRPVAGECSARAPPNCGSMSGDLGPRPNRRKLVQARVRASGADRSSSRGSSSSRPPRRSACRTLLGDSAARRRNSYIAGRQRAQTRP